jgi:hypothetical protein
VANWGIELLLVRAELIAVTDNYRAQLSQLRRERENLVLNLQGAPVTRVEALCSRIKHLNELGIQAHHIYQQYLYRKRIQVERLGFSWPELLRPSTRRSRCRISVSRAFVEDKGTQRLSLLLCLPRAEPRRQAWL